MLRPVIMIGCGGSGNKVVRYTRDAVERRLKQAGWDHGVPQAWQFIGIDTHGHLDDPSIPFLPSKDFVNLATHFGSYQDLDAALQVRFGFQGQQPNMFHEFLGWRPNPNDVNVPISAGAGQYRAVGRVLGLLYLQHHIHDRIQNAFDSCHAGELELLEVSNHLGVDVPLGQPIPTPLVLIVGSMAGGTGAGIMLDVIELVRKIQGNGAFPTLVTFTPDVFGSVENDGMAANSAAFMSELLNAYWDDQMPLRGPHSVFAIGRRTLDGLDLSYARNVYRAVGDFLSAVTTSVQVQQDFYNYKVVNWAQRAAANSGGYGFENHGLLLRGVASSFGSSTISIGRDRFRAYMQKLLLGSIVEQLTNGFEKGELAAIGGTETKPVTALLGIEEVARLNAQEFISDVGLSMQQIEENFVSNELMKSRLTESSQLVKNSLPSINERYDIWLQMIVDQAKYSKHGLDRDDNSEIEEKIQDWFSNVYQRVLVASNKFSPQIGLPATFFMIEFARSEVMKTASEMRSKAEESRLFSIQAVNIARNELQKKKMKLSSTSLPVQEAVVKISEASVWEWNAEVRLKLAESLESVATSVLTTITTLLRASNARLGLWGVEAGWPSIDGSVPASFAPSPVEFFLEEYTAWPQHARELIQQSLGNHAGLPSDPIEAASTLIIRGEFGNSSIGQSVFPLIWDEFNKNEPTWSPGQPFSVRVDESPDGLLERIDAWLSRPDTELNRVLTEDLSDYLMPVNPVTGEPVSDHLRRLETFREKLQMALIASRPLIEIDQSMNAVVHPMSISCSLSIEGFPFGIGHPARKVTEEIIQGFLGTSEPIDWAFTSAKNKSVALSSFLEYPVNPSVINSLTEPLARASVSLSPVHMRHLWQWRRSQVLGKFVPLPRSLRIAAIRGLAIARALGVMSAEELDQNVIADHDGDKQFPKWLLTPTDRNNLLPALLEAMVLSFAEVSTKGTDAFAAYEALIEYGSGDSFDGEFQVSGLLKHFLETGEYDGIRIVDEGRAESVSGDALESRAEKVIEYLQRNIQRFDELETSGPDPQSWRNFDGTVQPIDTLSHELLTEMRSAYEQVRDAISEWISRFS